MAARNDTAPTHDVREVDLAQMRLDYSTDQRVWDLLDEVERLRAELGRGRASGPGLINDGRSLYTEGL